MASLYGLKPWYTRRLGVFLDFAVRKNLSPDLFTAIGVGGAIFGALALQATFLPRFLIGLAMVAAVAVRLAGANLDGAVARARGVSRPFGFVLNELGDRLSDFILFMGFYLALPEHIRGLVFLVALAASLPTLVSISGAAVGQERINGGPFGKTERCLAFILLAFFLTTGVVPAAILGVVLFGSLQTAYLRAQRLRRALAPSQTASVPEEDLEPPDPWTRKRQ